MTTSYITKRQRTFGAGHQDNEIRRMEQERSTWMNAMAKTHSLADQIGKMVGPGSAAVQLAQQMSDARKGQEDSIRKMLDPLANIRSSLMNDRSVQRMMDEITKPVFATDHFAKLIDQVVSPREHLRTLFSSAQDSIEQTRRMLAETSAINGLQQITKRFEETNKRWTVPAALIDSISPLQTWQDHIGKLSFPVMDSASAATLANLLGRAGIESQLVALGINSDGSLNEQFAAEKDERGFGLSRKSMELMTLLSFILAILVPIYQDISSSNWQAVTDAKLATQADALEGQRKTIEALAKLVEKALVHEATKQEQRFVVRERVALVRSNPESGSSIVGKLFPREVVRPISEDGKWIQFEYYHWLHQEYRTGWALKKYFQRVVGPANNKVRIEQ